MSKKLTVEELEQQERTALIAENRKIRAKLRGAMAELSAIHRDNLSADEIRAEIYNLEAMVPDPPKWVIDTADAEHDVHVPVMFWSDWHWGEVVKPDQVGGANEFNRAIAKKRLQKLLRTSMSIINNYVGAMSLPGVILALGGDMISGNIHDELVETNDGSLQQTILELQDELAAAITVLADAYGKVFIPAVVGNHGRMNHKPRMKNRVFESYEWNLYQQLERFFRNDPRVHFMIPNGTDALFSVYGHRILLTHGDALGVKGGDGIIGALGPITRGAIKVGRSEAQIGRDFDTIMMGHWHTYIPRGEATPAMVNGTLKGYDEYARLGLRVPFSRPSQALFFVHPKHGITSQWPIYVDTGPKDRIEHEWLAVANL